jgi:hypothetical protein
VKNDRQHYRRPREPEDVWLPCEGNRGIQRTLRKVTELGGNYPDQRWWSTSLDKPPTGFSESDVGEFIPSHAACRRSIGVPPCGKPPDLECDVGLTRQPSEGHDSDHKDLRKVTDCRSETTWLTDDEIRHDSSLIMNITRFQICQN